MINLGNVVHILVLREIAVSGRTSLWHKPRVKEWLMVRVVSQEMMI